VQPDPRETGAVKANSTEASRCGRTDFDLEPDLDVAIRSRHEPAVGELVNEEQPPPGGLARIILGEPRIELVVVRVANLHLDSARIGVDINPDRLDIAEPTVPHRVGHDLGAEKTHVIDDPLRNRRSQLRDALPR
jgi:hypothetical protein